MFVSLVNEGLACPSPMLCIGENISEHSSMRENPECGYVGSNPIARKRTVDTCAIAYTGEIKAS